MDKPTTHIGIFVGDTIEQILSGKKTVEGRFSSSKIIPYKKVKKGDMILLKQSGGKIIGQAEADNALYFENLSGSDISKLRQRSEDNMRMGDDFWNAKRNAKVASI